VRSRGRRPAFIAVGVSVVALACKQTGTQIQLPGLEMLIASGDGQFGVVNENVGSPLRVVVRSERGSVPQEDVSVFWDVMEGSASLLGVSTTVTDSTGSTEIRLRMGATTGAVRVRASVVGQGAADANFHLFAVNRPTLATVSPGAIDAGGVVTLTGSDFSPIAPQNVVLFSGVRGIVVAATTTTLQVEVPTCLPARDVEVSVQLGVVPAAVSVPLTVTGGTQPTVMQVGEVIDVTDDTDLACHALSGGGGAEYLAVAYSASAVGAALHSFELTALSSVPPPAAGPAAGAPRRSPVPLEGGSLGSLQLEWDETLRGLEDGLLRAGARSVAGGPARVGPAAVPVVGERRTFNVLDSSGGFTQVSAEARHVGTRAAIFVDVTAPPPPDGFDDADLAGLAARFDGVIHPTVTGAFGAVSDIDANQRVIILLTPAVNRLTPRGSSGFIGGFFYGVDLLVGSTGSNQGEIFYALVPDPAGTFSAAHTRQQVLQAVPAVLAHEFQHMVHFNQRVTLRGASQEALWLSEGMAQMAEELVAREYWDLGDGGSAQLFRSGVVQRARRYLAGPDTVSLVVTAGRGTLAERGGGFLHVLYLEDQHGLGVLAQLSQTTRMGVDNVEAVTGAPWGDVLSDWWSALWLDGPGPESGPLTFPSIDLRAYLGPSFPLVPAPLGPGDASDVGSLWSSSARYYAVTPPVGGTISLRLGGEAGGPIAPESALRLRLIRIS